MSSRFISLGEGVYVAATEWNPPERYDERPLEL
jgi:hypothetical protein